MAQEEQLTMASNFIRRELFENIRRLGGASEMKTEEWIRAEYERLDKIIFGPMFEKNYWQYEQEIIYTKWNLLKQILEVE